MFQPDALQDLISKPVEAKTDPFSLGSLIAWLETKPAGAHREGLEDALRALIGHCEIAAVAPAAIGKTLVMQLDGPELTAARAALHPEGKSETSEIEAAGAGRGIG